jgi:hypothetical protein
MIGRYRLMEKIGEGGFGQVYVAEQQQPVRRRVALKLLKPGMDSREVIARFEAERIAEDHPRGRAAASQCPLVHFGPGSVDGGREPADGYSLADDHAARRSGLDRHESSGKGPSPPVRDGGGFRAGSAAVSRLTLLTG